jgi:hypothetical protein
MANDVQTSWARHLGASAVVSAVGVGWGIYAPMKAVGLLLLLLILGALAGAMARRTGWLAGIIVGLPVGLVHLTFLAIKGEGSFTTVVSMADYWRVLVPAAVCGSGVAILGAIAGAFLFNQVFRKT